MMPSITGKVVHVSDSMLKRKSLPRNILCAIYIFHLAYQRKLFKGICSLFTEVFKGKVRVTNHKNVITVVAIFFKRDRSFWLVSTLFSTFVFLLFHLVHHVLWWLFHISGGILHFHVPNYGRKLFYKIQYVNNQSCLYFSYITLRRRWWWDILDVNVESIANCHLFYFSNLKRKH